MSKAPQISNGKEPLDCFNGFHLSLLPAKTPFGNLLAARMSIKERIDYINLKLDSIYKPFPIRNFGIFPPLFHQLIDMPVEESIYLLRRSTDDLICLWSILNSFTLDQKYPARILIDCVGKLCVDIRTKKSNHDFYPSLKWLVDFNDVVNAYKHSFHQRQLQYISAREPMILALINKGNQTTAPPEFKEFTLSEIITGFDAFYLKADKWIDEWSKTNPENHQGSRYNVRSNV